MEGLTPDEDDALIAAAELVGRCGAGSLEIGFLHEDRPSEEADWYAHAQFKGVRVIAEKHAGPVEAAEALARQLLGDHPNYDDATCRRCNRVITLSSDDPAKCRWQRIEQRWVPGCGKAIDVRIKLRPFQKGK